jgi:hypothetical protein
MGRYQGRDLWRAASMRPQEASRSEMTSRAISKDCVNNSAMTEDWLNDLGQLRTAPGRWEEAASCGGRCRILPFNLPKLTGWTG